MLHVLKISNIQMHLNSLILIYLTCYDIFFKNKCPPVTSLSQKNVGTREEK